jgi:hypothetical protein
VYPKDLNRDLHPQTFSTELYAKINKAFLCVLAANPKFVIRDVLFVKTQPQLIVCSIPL